MVRTILVYKKDDTTLKKTIFIKPRTKRVSTHIFLISRARILNSVWHNSTETDAKVFAQSYPITFASHFGVLHEFEDIACARRHVFVCIHVKTIFPQSLEYYVHKQRKYIMLLALCLSLVHKGEWTHFWYDFEKCIFAQIIKKFCL